MKKRANPISRADKIREIDRNFAYFKKEVLPVYASANMGLFALLRDRKLIAMYDSYRDAQITGEIFYEDGLFSVQEVRTTPIDMGAYSHAPYLMDSHFVEKCKAAGTEQVENPDAR